MTVIYICDKIIHYRCINICFLEDSQFRCQTVTHLVGYQLIKLLKKQSTGTLKLLVNKA